jgi:hypothetical protein
MIRSNIHVAASIATSMSLMPKFMMPAMISSAHAKEGPALKSNRQLEPVDQPAIGNATEPLGLHAHDVQNGGSRRWCG